MINEPNVYRLITKSKLPAAERFETWIFEEVLPTIRKTGGYMIQPETLTPAQMNLRNAQLLVEIEKKQNEQEVRLSELEAKVTIEPDYYTVAGYASLHNVKIGLKTAIQLGRACSALCRKEGYDINSSRSTNFRKVNSYPSIALEQVFTEKGLLRKKQP